MKQCGEVGCQKKIYRTKYCRMHYARLLRHGNAGVVLRQQHGKARTSIYHAWQGMKVRCYSSNDVYYINYGGRGIKVCDRWINSFDNFYQDMGEKPTPSHTLDRIDNDGDYMPENCRWADRTLQSRNRRILKRNTSQYTGVGFNQGKYVAYITVNYQNIYLGRYDDFEEAVSARLSGEAIYWD